MKQLISSGSGPREITPACRQEINIRQRAERLYLMGELEAAAELLMLEAIQ